MTVSQSFKLTEAGWPFTFHVPTNILKIIKKIKTLHVIFYYLEKMKIKLTCLIVLLYVYSLAFNDIYCLMIFSLAAKEVCPPLAMFCL